jgi:hypothetical protein
LKQNKPIQKSWSKIFLTIATILEIGGGLGMALLCGIPLSFFTLFILSVSVTALAFAGTIIYELKKSANHQEIIEKYLLT